jgi:hypothetical protein
MLEHSDSCLAALPPVLSTAFVDGAAAATPRHGDDLSLTSWPSYIIIIYMHFMKPMQRGHSATVTVLSQDPAFCGILRPGLNRSALKFNDNLEMSTDGSHQVSADDCVVELVTAPESAKPSHYPPESRIRRLVTAQGGNLNMRCPIPNPQTTTAIAGWPHFLHRSRSAASCSE